MTGALWTARDAAKATGGEARGDWNATGVSIDTRSLAKGDLFVALVGENNDAHDYVPQAIEKGAAAAVVSKDVDAPALLRVEDTTRALEHLGRFGRDRAKDAGATLFGVTGSVGKTGVKEALHTALAGQGKTHATLGNLNNQFGAPLSLARMPADSRFGVFEMGMNHPGELTVLTEMVRPDVAIVTAIAPAHTEFFENGVEGIAEAKAEIFKGLDGGAAVLQLEGEWFELLSRRAREYGAGKIVTFGAHPDSDVQLLSSMMEAEKSLVNADVMGRRINFEIAMPGHHWVINSMGVLAMVAAAGADVDKAARALGGMTAPKGRGARYRIAVGPGTAELIDDAYNASPAAMRAMFEMLMLSNPGPGGRRIAVLGDMRELGDDAPALHAGLAPDLADRGIDLVLTCGPNMKHLSDALDAAVRGPHAADSEALLPVVRETLKPGDVVCVKGSLGSRMGIIVDALLKNRAEA